MATARTNTRCMLPPGWKNDVRARAIQAGLASGAPRSTMRSNFFCASARRCTVVVRAIEAAKRKCAGTSAKHACLIRARRLYRLLRVTCGAGPPTADSSCGEFAHFNLGAHFLDLRGLLFQLGRERLYFPLLLSNRSLQLVLQPFHFSVLFEKFIEQHRVDLLVAD